MDNAFNLLVTADFFKPECKEIAVFGRTHDYVINEKKALDNPAAFLLLEEKYRGRKYSSNRNSVPTFPVNAPVPPTMTAPTPVVILIH